MERYNQVSITKGIGIILMVLGHAICSEPIVRFIYMFHIPLFVCCSGYCFNEKYLTDARSFIVKRIKGLYLPFVIWTITFVLLHNLFCRLNLLNGTYSFSKDLAYPYSFVEIKSRILAAIFKMQNIEDLVQPIWFLRSLFLGSIFSYIVLRVIKRWWLRIIVPIVIASIFSLLIVKFGFANEIKTFVFFSFFFICGYLFKQIERKNDCNENIKQIFGIIFGFLLVFIGSILWPSFITSVSHITVVPYAISALGGIYAIWKVSGLLVTRSKYCQKILVYIGNNTMPILVLHFLSNKLVSILIIIIYNLPIERLAECAVIYDYSKLGWWVAYLIVGITVPLVSCELFAKLKTKILTLSMLR